MSLGRLLCLLGFHDWETWAISWSQKMIQCRRCHRYGQVGIDE